MHNCEFQLSNNETIEFQIDGQFEIIYNNPSAYLCICMDAVHLRAFIRCMTEALPELEQAERISEDIDLINGRGNLQDGPMPTNPTVDDFLLDTMEGVR